MSQDPLERAYAASRVDEERARLDAANTTLKDVIASVNEIGKILKDSFGAIEKAMGGTKELKAVGKQMNKSKFGKTVKDLGKMFKGIAGASPQMFALQIIFDLLKPLVQLFEIFEPILDAVGALLEILVVSAMQPLLDIITPLVPMIMSLAPIFSQIGGIIGQVIGMALEPLMMIFEALFPVIKQVIRIALEPLMIIFEALFPVIGQVIRIALEPLMMIFEALFPVIEPILEIIVSLMKIALSPLSVIFKVITAVIKPFLPLLDILGDVFKILTPLLKPLTQSFDILSDIIGGTLTNAIDFAIGFIKPIIGGFLGAIKLIANSIIWTINQIINIGNALDIFDIFPDIPNVPYLAQGGTPGNLFRAGEKGAEMITGDNTVIPLDRNTIVTRNLDVIAEETREVGKKLDVLIEIQESNKRGLIRRPFG